MAKFKVIFDREACIGALACAAVADKLYLQSDDGKVDLAGATFNEETKKFELVIEANILEVNKEAADACPVHAIEIIELK